MLPKNVRQIGQIEGNKRIYIEDYVMTYARKLEGMAVLLGRQEEEGDNTIFYIHGAVEVRNMTCGYPTVLNHEDWSSIYEDVKKHFLDFEIMGWLFVRRNAILEIDAQIRQIHEENFKGNHKILFLYDKGENEEAFYMSNLMGELKKQSGYYIFYEKNEAMQNYMLERRPNEKVEEVIPDDAMLRVREIIAQKEPQKNEKKIVNLMYGASTLLAAAVLVIGATMLDNYDKVRNMEETLNTISSTLGQEQTDQGESVVVERMEGNTEKEKDNQENARPEGKEGDENTKDEKEPEGKMAEEEDNSTEKKDNQDREVGDVTTGQDQKDEEIKPNDGMQNEEEADEPVIAEPGDALGEYIVESGDTLASISMKFYQSYSYMDEIQELNQIDDTDIIYAGQSLKLP